jgi:hypothetical protein
MTPAQLTTLKNFINADPTLSAVPAGSDGDYFIAEQLNKEVAPAFIVWRTDVRAEEIGNAWIGTDIDGMSALNMQRLQLLLDSAPTGVFNMSRADRRAGFENPFGTNQNNASRVAMREAWKRPATVFEKLFATGTGSSASPATMVLESPVSWPDVGEARRLA